MLAGRSARLRRERSLGPKILTQNRIEIVEPDTPAGQLFPIPMFGQKGLTAEHARPLDDRLLEREVLERVQRVVVNEDRDRALSRQKVRGMFDQVMQMLK